MQYKSAISFCSIHNNTIIINLDTYTTMVHVQLVCRLRKNLKQLIVVHPTWLVRSLFLLMRPFVRSVCSIGPRDLLTVQCSLFRNMQLYSYMSNFSAVGLVYELSLINIACAARSSRGSWSTCTRSTSSPISFRSTTSTSPNRYSCMASCSLPKALFTVYF